MLSRPSLVAGLAVLLLLLGACGGDDDGGSADPGRSESTGDGGSDEGSSDDGSDDGSGDTDGGNGDDSSSSGGGTSGSRDLCALLTVDEIQAHFGDEAAFDDGESNPSTCVFNSTDSLAGFGQVQIQYQSDAVGLGFSTFVEMVSDPIGSTNTEEISGLGDQAYLSEGGMITLVFVALGDDVLVVGVMGAEDEAAAAQELAAIAIGRL